MQETKTVTLTSAAYTYWTLSADPKAVTEARNEAPLKELPPGVFGSSSMLNGKSLPASLADGHAIEKIPVAGKTTHDGKFTLPPFSVTFAVAPRCPV